jgi:hypothetical protein
VLLTSSSSPSQGSRKQRQPPEATAEMAAEEAVGVNGEE